ncbi:MAG: pyocin knob domain-containing protein, partial [Streptococcus salivarius]|nr:pyocin knob domain-containing protein [Streptococcus salivarius]
ISVDHYQVEKGNVATDWRPAPEDAENEISTALVNETTARTNADNSVLSQAKAYTDTAKSDLTAAMNKADASVLGQANAYTDFALRQVWTPTVITTAIDLNNVKACGSYFIKNMLGTTSNTPIPNAWLYVRVEGVPTRITQTVWKDIDPTVQWVRVFMDNSWGNWTQITKAI